MSLIDVSVDVEARRAKSDDSAEALHYMQIVHGKFIFHPLDCHKFPPPTDDTHHPRAAQHAAPEDEPVDDNQNDPEAAKPAATGEKSRFQDSSHRLPDSYDNELALHETALAQGLLWKDGEPSLHPLAKGDLLEFEDCTHTVYDVRDHRIITSVLGQPVEPTALHPDRLQYAIIKRYAELASV